MQKSHSDHSQGSSEEAVSNDSVIPPPGSPQFTVHCSTTDGSSFEGRTTGIRGRTLFIETEDRLAVGTMVTVEFADPRDPRSKGATPGLVIWICATADQFNFAPGMGVRLLEAPASQGRTERGGDPSLQAGSPRPLC